MSAVGRVLSLVVDCSDPRSLASFWQALVGGRVDSRTSDDSWVALTEVPGLGHLGFQKVPEAKSVKNRVHLDVDVVEIAKATVDAESLGGRRRGDVVDEGTNWTQVMIDPEENEFCFIQRKNPQAVAPLTGRPWTRADMVSSLRDLGVNEGDMLIVHSSLSAMGYVVGGAQAVVDALIDAVGPDGTIVMPSQTADWSDPAEWTAPPVPESWWHVIRDETPPFDVHGTPPINMGAIPLALLLRRETLRSNHPRLSVMAHGRDAEKVVARHDLDEGLGPDSPMGVLLASGAKVLLLGVGHERNTSLHLAEVMADWPQKRSVTQGSRVSRSKGPEWATYSETDYDASDFAAVGDAFDATGAVRRGSVAGAEARVMSMRDLVDFAIDWFSSNRS